MSPSSRICVTVLQYQNQAIGIGAIDLYSSVSVCHASRWYNHHCNQDTERLGHREDSPHAFS
jgi:hypothetical protein